MLRTSKHRRFNNLSSHSIFSAKNKIPWIAACAVLAPPRWALACAACMGRADDTTVQGLNAAVLTMLGALAMVLAAIAGSMFYFVRRAARHPLALPGETEGVVR